MLSLLRVGFFDREERRPNLKCKGKEPSMSNKLIIDVIGFNKMSRLSFTRLVGMKIQMKKTVWEYC